MSAPSRGLVASHRGILEELVAARRMAAGSEFSARADSVSHWGVQQHLDHLLLTNTLVLEGLQSSLSDPAADGPSAAPSGGPTLKGRFILLTGIIPRGKAKAPEKVVPGDRSASEVEAGFASLHSGFLQLAGSLGAIQSVRGTQDHPMLGVFSSAQWLRFAHIHHRHHGKIIADILRAGT